MHVFAMLSHARRFYRALEHTTNANLTLHELQPGPDERKTSWPQWGRHEALEEAEPKVPSLLVLRERNGKLSEEEEDDAAAQRRKATAAVAAAEMEAAEKEALKAEADNAADQTKGKHAEPSAATSDAEELRRQLHDDWELDALSPEQQEAMRARAEAKQAKEDSDEEDDPAMGDIEEEDDEPMLGAPDAKVPFASPLNPHAPHHPLAALLIIPCPPPLWCPPSGGRSCATWRRGATSSNSSTPTSPAAGHRPRRRPRPRKRPRRRRRRRRVSRASRQRAAPSTVWWGRTCRRRSRRAYVLWRSIAMRPHHGNDSVAVLALQCRADVAVGSLPHSTGG